MGEGGWGGGRGTRTQFDSSGFVFARLVGHAVQLDTADQFSCRIAVTHFEASTCAVSDWNLKGGEGRGGPTYH